MAYGNMTPAVAGGIASAAANNQIITNVEDLDTRLDTVESRTTDTTTGGATLGIGNQRLADRLGTGVSNTTNVTTGTATAQLTDLRSRASVLESRTTNVTYGNTALDTRVATLEGATTVPAFFHGYYTGGGIAVSSAAYTPVTLDSETVDNKNGHSTSTNTSRYVPGTLGWYECFGAIIFPESATPTTQQLGARIQKNGAAVANAPLFGGPATSDQTAGIITSVWAFAMVQVTNVTDYIEIAGVTFAATTMIAGSFLRVRFVSA